MSSVPILALVVSLGALAAAPAAAQAQTKPQGGMPMKEGMQMEMGKEAIVEGQGKVVAIVPAKNQVVLKHDEMKGQMGAMTMGYDLASPTLAQGLKPGDSVKFRIDTANQRIVAIERMK